MLVAGATQFWPRSGRLANTIGADSTIGVTEQLELEPDDYQ